MFAVDDIIVTDAVDLNQCTDAMEKYDAWGFFLRLGKNITRCYMIDAYTGVPKGKDREDTFFVWKFKNGSGDWNYPNTVDQTIYRKKDIEGTLRYLNYTNPNTLEGGWANNADHSLRGISFQATKNVNLPMNLVNTSWRNRCEFHYTVQELHQLFKSGLKIDIDAYKQIKNESPHMNYKPGFVKR
jgi:hypothetical protein